MDIGELNVGEQTTLSGHLLVKRRAGNRRVEHELVEVGLIADCRFDFFDDVVWRVVLKSDNGRALHAYAVFAKLARELGNVVTLQLAVAGLGGLQTHPYPGNAEFDQFQHGVFSNRIGGSKDRKLPALLCFLHALQQAHGTCTVKQEVFVHHKEGIYLELRFDAAHHIKQFIAGLVEVDELSFAAKKSRCGAEVASHRAAHGWDDGCRRAAPPLREAHSHDACLQTGNNGRMADRCVLVFSQIPAHPGDAFSAHDVVGVDHRFQAGDGGYMSAYHDHRIR